MSGGAATRVTRPALRWHGGKWLLAPRIIDHFPPHRIYVEPFGGAASVLLRKPRAYAEIYNDLDEDVVGFFRVMREPNQARELLRRIRRTPFARAEFDAAYEPVEDDPLERARRLVIRSFMGFGANAHNTAYSTGFRATSNRSGTTPAHDWSRWPDAAEAIAERFMGVVVECREAREVMAAHDRTDTLHYVDPPYLHETRSHGNPHCLRHLYTHEMRRDDHVALLASLRALSGMVVLSAYRDPLYDETLTDWCRLELAAYADGARRRIEVLWINPAAVAAAAQGDLFLKVGA